MTQLDVQCVRIYLTEQDKYTRLVSRLHDVEKVRGVTVFRGLSGFGRSGEMHSSQLVDTALDLPIVVEFFDEPGRAAAVIERLRELVPGGHIVSWPARVEE